MPFAASHSRATNLSDAIRSVTGDVLARLGGVAPDFSFLFVSHAHTAGFSQIATRVCEATGIEVLIGCTGETIIGGDEEIESGPALSLWSAAVPAITVEPFCVQFERTADGIAMSGLPPLSAGEPDLRAVFLLADPYSSAPQSVLDHLETENAGVPLHGGMASGGRGPGDNCLFYNSNEVRHGAVGLAIRGGPPIRSVVSQGCRPIGTHYVVTRAEDNIIQGLGGIPPMQRLKELFATLSERDGQLVQLGLHIGLAMNEYQEHFERGDFLIANVIGAEPLSGSIAVGVPVRVGQTVRFHVRDAETADEDLRGLLEADRDANPAIPKAGLLFSCNGRGTHLFDEPNHDAAMLRALVGPVPVAGFFAQGELGPIGGRNHLHGFTASIALFE